jgi:hypothetical protein
MLQRRTFLGLLAGVAGAVLSLTRALTPSAWWRRPKEVQDAPTDIQNSTPTENRSGIKITTIRRWGSRDSSDITAEPRIVYLQGAWRRLELPRTFNSDGSSGRVYGPHIVNIVRTDLGQIFQLNLDASEYTRMPYPPRQKSQPLTKEQLAARGIKMPSPGEEVKPTFRIETVTKDTGERKEMFGYLARHVVTTRKEIPLEGSRHGAQEVTTDGWYIDLEPQLYPSLYPPPKQPDSPSGQSVRVHSFLSISSHRPGEEPQVPERPEFIDIGKPEMGFALQEVRTSRSTLTLPNGTTNQSEQKAETTVTIERGTYSAGLFEVPSGFRRVQYINPNPA